MEVAKLTLGKTVYKNLTGEKAGIKMRLHNAMKNIPAFISDFTKEFEHIKPRGSSFTELPSDFFTKDSHIPTNWNFSFPDTAILLAGPKGNGKSEFAKTGGLAGIVEKMKKHHLNPLKFEMTPIKPNDELLQPYKMTELTAEQKELLEKIYKENPPKFIFPESGVGKTQISKGFKKD